MSDPISLLPKRRAKGADADELQCPGCGRWRPAFVHAALSAADVTLRGIASACDGCRSKWKRGG